MGFIFLIVAVIYLILPVGFVTMGIFLLIKAIAEFQRAWRTRIKANSLVTC